MNPFWIVGILLVVTVGLAAVILFLTSFIDWVFGQRRHGALKESTYESGMEPIGDTRRRFNVRFYLVAVLFLVFDVEIVFLYPWALAFTAVSNADPVAAQAGVLGELAAAGYTPGYMYGAMFVFFMLLIVGLVYEWRKGLFRWD